LGSLNLIDATEEAAFPAARRGMVHRTTNAPFGVAAAGAGTFRIVPAALVAEVDTGAPIELDVPKRPTRAAWHEMSLTPTSTELLSTTETCMLAGLADG
jgi:hypothetical protein